MRIEVSYYDFFEWGKRKYFKDIETSMAWYAYSKGLIRDPYGVEKVYQHPDKDCYILDYQ